MCDNFFRVLLLLLLLFVMLLQLKLRYIRISYHQYIVGFMLTEALLMELYFLIRDYYLEQNEDNL